MSEPRRAATGPGLNPEVFAREFLAKLPPGQFDPAPVLYHVAALAAFRAAQRMVVVPPKIPEHVAADVAAAFRNVAYSSQIPEVRAGAAFLSTVSAAAALRDAAAALWPKFFGKAAA